MSPICFLVKKWHPSLPSPPLSLPCPPHETLRIYPHLSHLLLSPSLIGLNSKSKNYPNTASPSHLLSPSWPANPEKLAKPGVPLRSLLLQITHFSCCTTRWPRAEGPAAATAPGAGNHPKGCIGAHWVAFSAPGLRRWLQKVFRNQGSGSRGAFPKPQH